MKAASVLAVGASWILVSAALAQEPAPSKGPMPEAARLVVMAASDLKWSELDRSGAPGVMVAPLWGDMATGAFGAFLKLPAGFSAPLHTHTHDMRVVFISGTYIQKPEGGPEFRLGPGSYMMQPGGAYRHVTSCDTASDCVFFFESDGAFDLHPVTP